jgi:regulator of replication initiation timing
MNAQKLPLVATWQGVINALLTDRYVSQKAEKVEAERARQKAENEVESFIGAFDEDNKNLRKQIEELTRANTSLQMENQGLRSKLSGVEDVPILFLGAEEEFYQGEIKEMILDAVAENLKNVEQKTRRADVLNDVLQNNDYQRVGEERERIVKTMFKEYKTLTPSVRQQLQELGFEITEEGKHYRLTYYGDDRYKTTFSKTGSDWREGKNMASTIIKNMM